VADARGGAGRAATPQALARSAGAGTVVTGSVYKLGDSLQLQAQVVDGRTGDVLTALDPVRGAARDPLPAVDALRQRALGALAGRLDARVGGLARVTGRPPLYAAYQEFVAGMDEWTRTGETRGATPYFRRATQIDTGYAQAWLFLANSLFNDGRKVEADAIVTRVDGMRDRLSPLERALLDIFIAHRRNDRNAELAARRAAAAAAPRSEWTWILVEGLAMNGRLQEALDSLVAVPDDLPFLRSSAARPVFEAEIRHRFGDHARELAVVRAALPRFTAPRARLRLEAQEVAALAALGRTAEARERLARLADAGAGRRGELAAMLHSLTYDAAWHGWSALAREAGERELAIRLSVAADSGGVPRVQRQLAGAYYALGRYDDADRVLRPLAARDTASETQGLAALVAARRGDTTTATRLAARFAERGDRPYETGGVLRLRASVAAVLGQREAMLALLRQGAAAGFGIPWVLHGDPDFAAYQRDPDVAALLAPIR
jgi:thioredoxin-like negative regulator of GroEL